MLLKDLITKLQELDASFDQEYREIMGEPEITIDVFSATKENPHLFQYSGIHTRDIVITYSEDGVYPILSAFAASYPKETQHDRN